MMNGQMYTEIPVVFENVRFHRATNIPNEGTYCGADVRYFMISLVHVGCFICVLS